MKSGITFILISLFFSSYSYAQCFPDRHSTSTSSGWLSCFETQNPNTSRGNSHWILYDLGEVHEIKESHFWNVNDPENLNQGVQEVVLDISLDGTSWWEWGTFTIEQSNGSSFYEGTEGPDFSGTNARYLLFTPLSNYGGSCYGFSELKINVDEELISSTEELLEVDMSLSPNPADNRTLVEFKTDLTGMAVLQVVDNIGRIVMRESLNISNVKTYEINTSEFQSGLYQVSLLMDKQIKTIELSIVH